MSFNPKSILITPKPGLAEELVLAYLPELLLNGIEIASSPHAALQNFMELPIDLCLISDSFKPDDYKAIVNDVKRLEQHKACIFVVVAHVGKLPTDRSSLKQFGVDTIITTAGTPEDKAAITGVLKEKLYAWELQRRLEDCSTGLGLLTKDVERIARERKRGKLALFNTSVSDFLRSNIRFAPEVEERYFEVLFNKLENAEPFTASAVDVPQEILDRDLPKLGKTRYHGASSRVWERLLQKFGDTGKKAESSPSGAENSSGDSAELSESKE